MEDAILQKLERLKRYIPFIDYLLGMDDKKYKKFVNIKQWIIMKNRHPLHVLEKIEKALVTQYRNLFLEKEDVKIPKSIMDIFNNNGVEIKYINVNLCSDEEDEQTIDTIKVSDAGLKGVSDQNAIKNPDSQTNFITNKAVINLSNAVETINLSDTLTSISSREGPEPAGILTLVDTETNELLHRIDEISKKDVEPVQESRGSWRYDDFDFPGLEEFEEEGEIIEEKLFKRRGELEQEEREEKGIEEAPNEMSATDRKKKSKKKKKKKDKDKDKNKNKSHKKKQNNLLINDTIVIDSTTDDEGEDKHLQNKYTERKTFEERILPESTPPLVSANNSNNSLQAVIPKSTSPLVSLQESSTFPSANASTQSLQASINASETVREAVPKVSDLSFENMEVDDLIKVFQDLTKENGIDLEKYLKNLLSNVSLETTPTLAATTIPKQTEPGFEKIQNESLTTVVNSPIQSEFQQENSKPPDRAVEIPNSIIDPLPIATQPKEVNYNYMQQATNQMYQYPNYHIEQNCMTPITFCQPQPLVYPHPQPPQPGAYFNNNGRGPNLKDPRIIKHLNMMQNSPVFSGAVRETCANLTSCIPRLVDPPRAQKRSASPGPTTYLEHKRLKAEQTKREENERRVRAERVKRDREIIEQREREKIEQQEREKSDQREKEKREEREKREHKEKTNEIRTLLREELQPFREQIQNVFRKENNRTSLDDVAVLNDPLIEEDAVTNNFDNTKVNNDHAIPKPSTASEKHTNRALKELECTVKGFDQFHDYIPKIGGKRRSSVSARTAIAEQLNGRVNYGEQNPNIDQNLMANIFEDSSQITTKVSKRRKSIVEVPSTVVQERLRTSDDKNIDPLVQTINSSSDDDITDFEKFQLQKKYSLILKRQPIVLLRCLTEDEIAKYATDKSSNNSKQSPKQLSLNVELVEDISRPASKKLKLGTDNITAKPTIKRKNIDCRMTERNTRCCILCRSKPSDLTNHYIRAHKTESYIARLNWEELDELQLNIPFAVPTTTGTASGIPLKYKVKCPFCEDEVVDKFANLHTHYSTHTGEYAFQCSMCKLQKPFRADIQSHQLHSKSCRQAKVLNIYVYPKDLLVIYVHCCRICNFLQLNEANVHKHLRDHHGNQQDKPKNVDRYILAAINNSEAISDRRPSKAESDCPISEVGDDVGITVCNEPVCEEKLEPEELLSELFNNVTEEFIIEPKIETSTSTPLEYTTRNFQNLSVVNADSVNSSFVHNISSTDGSALTPQRPVSSRTSSESMSSLPLSQPPALHLPMQLPEDIKPDIVTLEAQVSAYFEGAVEKQMQALHKPTPMKEQTPDTSVVTQQELPVPNKLTTPPRSTSNVAVTSPLQQSPTSPNILTQVKRLIQSPLVKKSRYNLPHIKYQTYQSGTYYFGLFKCMAADCNFCTDSDDEMLQHLNAHINSECPPPGILDCSYCQLNADSECSTTPQGLVTHISQRHGRNLFQCSECCYRSCLAGNVVIHRQHAHPATKKHCVFKCETRGISEVDPIQRLPQMIEAMSKNVLKLICSHCSYGFYAIASMDEHLLRVHKIDSTANDMMPVHFCCIYCPANKQNKQAMQEHLALQHPDELAFVCERVLKPGLKVDSVHNLELSNISLVVPAKNIKSTSSVVTNKESVLSSIRPANALTKLTSTIAVSSGTQIEAAVDAILKLNNESQQPKTSANPADAEDTSVLQDLKPSSEDLVRIFVETLKPLLLKLTAESGVAPDRLYQCANLFCGGFFSIYVLWAQHMRLRHNCAVASCPHCPAVESEELSLEEFHDHFELHCRHLYLCFHCVATFVSETKLREHATLAHNLSNEDARIESIPFSISYSYYVLIDVNVHTERLAFLMQLQEVLRERLRQRDVEESERMLTQWVVPFDADEWLDNFPIWSAQRQVEKRCLSPGCPYRTREDSHLFEHMRQTHSISGQTFKCSKCSFVLKQFNHWDEIADHINMHYSNLYVCCVCRYYHWDRSRVTAHLRKEHDLRDVAVLSLFRSEQETRIAIAIVFATTRKTFSTLTKCFCCAETGLSMETFAAHLKGNHALTLRYSCELCGEPLPQLLQQSETHMREKHATQGIALKIRCELATSHQVTLRSLAPLHLDVAVKNSRTKRRFYSGPAQTSAETNAELSTPLQFKIKDEPFAYDSDEDVLLLEEDDFIVSEEMKNTACTDKEKEKQSMSINPTTPLIKCINIQNLTTTPPRTPAPVSRPITIRLVQSNSPTAVPTTSPSTVTSVTWVPDSSPGFIQRQSPPTSYNIPKQITERQLPKPVQTTFASSSSYQGVFYNKLTGQVRPRLSPQQQQQQRYNPPSTFVSGGSQLNNTRPQVIVAFQGANGPLQLPRPHNSHTG